jgi:nanoRNase/pAp phosphatase (c-di-AMP/oligoRNAs hydrolase)
MAPCNGAGANGEKAPGGGRRSEGFLKGLTRFDTVTLVSHVHPDPDSLGSMLGLAYLIQKKTGLPSTLTQDGFIGRAENQAMVAALDIALAPIEEIPWGERNAVVMVDSQPNTGRHSLPADVPLYAVIDHHEVCGDVTGVPFVDIRSGLGATCTLVTGYLMEQRVEPPPRIATALFYGIESELTGYPREASPLDDGAHLYLFEYAQKDLLARIRNARLPHTYFETLVQALQNTFTYDKLVSSWAGELPQPEMAAEIADFLIRLDEVEWAFCTGIYQDNLILSVRSVHPTGQAGALLQQVVGRLGRAGGHDRRAGGSIPLASTAASAVEQLRAQLRRRLLHALDIDECRGQRLVSRRELLQSLQA